MINGIKELLKLSPQKLTIAILLIAVSFLWYKLENVEQKGDGKDVKSDSKIAKIQAALDSTQALRVKEEKEHSSELAAKDLEMKEFLKQMLAEQKVVKSRIKKVENNADKAIVQTETKLNPNK